MYRLEIVKIADLEGRPAAQVTIRRDGAEGVMFGGAEEWVQFCYTLADALDWIGRFHASGPVRALLIQHCSTLWPRGLPLGGGVAGVQPALF